MPLYIPLNFHFNPSCHLPFQRPHHFPFSPLLTSLLYSTSPPISVPCHHFPKVVPITSISLSCAFLSSHMVPLITSHLWPPSQPSITSHFCTSVTSHPCTSFLIPALPSLYPHHLPSWFSAISKLPSPFILSPIISHRLSSLVHTLYPCCLQLLCSPFLSLYHLSFFTPFLCLAHLPCLNLHHSLSVPHTAHHGCILLCLPVVLHLPILAA